MRIITIIKNFIIDFAIQRAFLGGDIPSIDGRVKIYSTRSTGYEQLKDIFLNHFIISKDDSIVDVGCGKGRVFNFLLYKGFKNKMIGYEINMLIGNKTRKNLSRFNNVEIISDNIFNNFPNQANIFYLFNPFNLELINNFKECIWNIRENNPTILYFTPKFIEAFDDNRFVYTIKKISPPQFGVEDTLAIICIKK